MNYTITSINLINGNKMLIEYKHFEFTSLGYSNAVYFLKEIGRYSEEHKYLPIDNIINEANKIKSSQQFLVE